MFPFFKVKNLPFSQKWKQINSYLFNHGIYVHVNLNMTQILGKLSYQKVAKIHVLMPILCEFEDFRRIYTSLSKSLSILQVQIQMFLTKCDFCYFYVHSPNQFVCLQIPRDDEFL